MFNAFDISQALAGLIGFLAVSTLVLTFGALFSLGRAGNRKD